jgi:tetratricopeptide (TPR) repeat protein
MIYKKIFFQLLIFLSLGIIFSCSNKQNSSNEKTNPYYDSLSIKLNSPELKNINAQLLDNPNDAGLYAKRSIIYLKLKQFTEAENDAKRAIVLDSSKAENYLCLVDVYYAQNKTRQVKEYLEKCTKKFPDNTEALLKIDDHLAKAYFIKGSIYRESGDTAKAISSLETATEQDNNFIDAYYDLGILYAARKNPLAFDYYKNVLNINPKHNDALYARAKLLQDLNKIDEAIAEYISLSKINPNCENCFYNLGAIYLETKHDNNKALEYFTKAINVNPNYVEAYFARGYTYSKLKNKSSAMADYNMCLKIQPNYDAAVQALNEF